MTLSKRSSKSLDSGDSRKPQTNEELAGKTLARLETEIEQALGMILDDVQSLALVDFPDHSNVGDSAIYLGEIEWLRSRGIVPQYVCSAGNFSAESLQRAVPSGPILIHGGGNFGDVWPHLQEFREAVLTAFPQRRIIQLPQTIHFNDVAAQNRAAEKVAAHGNVLLLVRDQRSFDLACNAFKCEVRLCPDMALALGPRRRPVEARHDTLLLLRTDKEKANREILPALPDRVAACDWLDEAPDLRVRVRRWSAFSSMLAAPTRAFDRNYQREQFYRILAARRVARGLHILASGSRIITDRLHGHILGLLLGIPHIVLDNNYGKLRAFIETWTNECGLVTCADSLSAALAPYYSNQRS
jgi:exopolysaccharide biosynthesis predicted pyruvyltransferase EpsI